MMADTLLFELFMLSLVGFGGSALLWLVGLRNPLLIAGFGVLASSAARTLTFLGVTSLPQGIWRSEYVWGVFQLLAILVACLYGWSSRSLRQGFLLSALMLSLAFLSKFAFAIGERHHSDSATAVAIATLLFQNDEVSSNSKRGLAYPLLLALGPDGAILSTVTVYIFLGLALVFVWVFRILAERFGWPPLTGLFGVSLVALGASTPMIRVIPFYMNGHVLLALCLAALLVIFFARAGRLNGTQDIAVPVLLISGFVAGTTRIEAFLLFWLTLVALMPVIASSWRRPALVSAFVYFTPGLATFLWLGWSHTNPFPFPLYGFGVVLGVVAVGAGWLYSLESKRIAGVVSFFTTGGLLTGLVSILVATTSGVRESFLRTIENVAFGYGGWGFVFPAVLSALLILGVRPLREPGGALLLAMANTVIFTFLIKFVESGAFGGTVFWDTINRSWIHALPILFGLLVWTFFSSVTQSQVGVGNLAINLRRPDSTYSRTQNVVL